MGEDGGSRHLAQGVMSINMFHDRAYQFTNVLSVTRLRD